ncbi:DUF3231 family protein [Halalkalibacter akibai]|uniref:DUF3231 family protein n=1 Tax=Halalkalibacter akibai (strain ATCC 43226 / DSM 21942 / CIP 109018 / JCM 9157 / 1139) TaxID=1236973 RepID=W4QVS4_HALA3|nr:DUF3231 family protein [Halalkalibacter akibai]GAE36206.1 hypothetical protein JCM9157_3363 [Halalkalibacter akibai JCM 9157]
MSEHIRLTAAEIGAIWACYMTESATIPMLKYFYSIAEDSEVKSVIELALETSKEHLNELGTLFEKEEYPTPVGFSEEDVNLNAPRLFSDTYALYFIRNFGKAGLAAHGAAVSSAAREDIRALYKRYLQDAVEIEDEAKKALLSKGLFIRPPHLPTPKEAEFVKNETFLRGWLGERRPLTAEEITHMYMNYMNNLYGKSLLLGFAQTAQIAKVKKHFVRGVELSKDILDVLKILLEESNLPAPMTWDAEVSASSVSVFSDKLMMFQANALSAISLANIGGSIALSFRRDIAAKYSKQMINVGFYAEDGAEIMINNGWLELPPIAANRNDLVNQKK